MTEPKILTPAEVDDIEARRGDYHDPAVVQDVKNLCSTARNLQQDINAILSRRDGPKASGDLDEEVRRHTEPITGRKPEPVPEDAPPHSKPKRRARVRVDDKE